MRYFWLIVANVTGLAVAGRLGLSWLPLVIVAADFLLWRHWTRR